MTARIATPAPLPDYTYEAAALARGLASVAGVDEAGRGPLAGPVTAAAVILDPGRIPPGLNDSKKLTAAARARLYDIILRDAQVAVAHASVEEIDAINILNAAHLAMARALAQLAPAHALIDGNLCPRDLACSSEALVKGDGRCLSIAAASIVAKVVRDRHMVDLAQQHPGYGWEVNCGYPTPCHLQALLDLGVTPFHRRSFAPVHKILCQEISISY